MPSSRTPEGELIMLGASCGTICGLAFLFTPFIKSLVLLIILFATGHAAIGAFVVAGLLEGFILTGTAYKRVVH